MNLIKRIGIPLLAGSMVLTSSSLANSEESKENAGMSISKILNYAERIRETIPPSRTEGGKNEGKKGFYYAWDLTGDGLYNLITFHDFYLGTIHETKDLIGGMLNHSPYSIFINFKDLEHYDTRKGDIFLRRSEDGNYEKAEYVESEKEI